MKALHVLILVAASVATFGALMPLAHRGDLFMSVHHLGGPAFALYVVAPLIILFCALTLTGVIRGGRAWYLPPAIVGLALSALIAFGSVDALDSRRLTPASGSAIFGLGSYALVLGYLTILIVAMFTRVNKTVATPTTT